MTWRIARPVAVVAVAVVALAGLTATTPHASADPSAPSPLVLDASQASVSVAPLPCDRHGELDVSMTNTGDTATFVDALFDAPSQLVLSRGIWSTYLPATEPDQTVSAPLRITAAPGTRPGRYRVRMSADGQRLDIPVTVTTPPGTGPTDNLALYRQAFASSTHPNVTLCGGVDGNTDSEQWGASGTHDRTASEFPDTYGVRLDAPAQIGRVEVYTLDSQKYPAAKMGIRDFDVQVRVDGAWQTVASVRGNEVGHVSLSFTPVTGDEVQIVTLDSNDHKYSRIIELEAYQS